MSQDELLAYFHRRVASIRVARIFGLEPKLGPKVEATKPGKWRATSRGEGTRGDSASHNSRGRKELRTLSVTRTMPAGTKQAAALRRRAKSAGIAQAHLARVWITEKLRSAEKETVKT